MFGISFTELLLVGLVALLVLGPERLPGAARTAGLWIGRVKRSFNAIKADIEHEIGAHDNRRPTPTEYTPPAQPATAPEQPQPPRTQ